MPGTDPVRRGPYVMTTHADEEADADDLSVFDVESTIFTGAIVRRKKRRNRRVEIPDLRRGRRPQEDISRRKVWRLSSDRIYP